jgi:histidine triad (HIT) family protein
MGSIFSKIVTGEIPSYKVAETNTCLAFLDIFPLTKGHTLVIPKKEIDYLFDIDDALLSDLIVFSKRVSKAIDKSVPCLRVGVAVVGLEVPHAHIHLIPLHGPHDIDFSKPKLKLSVEEMTDIANKIKSNFI